MAAASAADPGLTAICLGSTGAIGLALVAELLASPRWSRIVLLVRRRLGDGSAAVAAAERAGRLEQVVADTSPGAAGYAPHAALLAGADAAFCTVGAPRGSVGSATEYARVNTLLPLEAAALCRGGGGGSGARCRHFSLVSTVGANAASAIPYLRLKGEVEAELAALGFESLALWRPGLLARGALASTWQRVACALLPSMPVATVARAMRVEAEAALARGAPTGAGASSSPLFNSDILARARRGAQ